jgi:hypothetical protein
MWFLADFPIGLKNAYRRAPWPGHVISYALIVLFPQANCCSSGLLSAKIKDQRQYITGYQLVHLPSQSRDGGDSFGVFADVIRWIISRSTWGKQPRPPETSSAF